MNRVRTKLLMFVLSVLILVTAAGSAWGGSVSGPTTAVEGDTKTYSVSGWSASYNTFTWLLHFDGDIVNQAAASTSHSETFREGPGSYGIEVRVKNISTGRIDAYLNTQVTVTARPAPTLTMDGARTTTAGNTERYTVAHNSSLPVTSRWSVDGTVITGAVGTSVDIPFATKGTYNVSVTVYPTGYPNSNSTVTIPVVVSPAAPTLTMTGSTTSIEGETKQYTVTANTSDPVTIEWSVNGTVINGAVDTSVDIPFATVGAQNVGVTVFLTAYPSAIATGTIPVTVSAYPAPTITMAGPTTSTEGETKQYTVTTSTSDPVTIEWSVNGAVITGAVGTSVEIPFTAAGHSIVGVTVAPTAYPNSKRTGSIPVTVSAYPAPTITMTGSTTSFIGETKQYTVTHDSSSPVTIEWKLDGSVINGAVDTSVGVTFATKGNSSVAVTVFPTAHPNSKKTGAVPVTVSGYPAPTITMAGPRTSTEGKTEQYTVTHDSSLPVTIEWDVKGVKYQGSPVDVPFPAAGTYNVAVTVYPTAYPDSKRTGTIPVTVSVVKAPLVAIATIKGGYVGTPIDLIAKATVQSTGIPLVVNWDMPDGTSVNALNATYTPKLADVGKATFKFSAYPEGFPNKKKEGAFQVPITNYVFPSFTLKNYTRNTGIVPHFVFFAAEANLRGFTEKLSYSWDMGDGAVMPDKNKANYTYTEPGEYTVTLTVSDTRGNSKVVTDTVSVTPVELISIDAITVKGTNQYMRAPVVGIFKTTVSGGNPRVDPYRTYAWTVNGQPTGRNSSTTTHTFTEPGTNEVGLTVTSKNGLTGSGTTTVEITPNIPPECTIEATDYPARKYTKLVAKCTDADGRIRTSSWDLGNGQTSKSGIMSVKYMESGTYTVSLTATDDSGGSVTVSKDVVVQR